MTVGTILDDRYELRHRLGAGGTAEVFLGFDRRLGREVAIKTLLPGAASDPAFVRRFRHEAQAAAALSHPNVVAVYDWGSSGGTDYLVMEYVSGPNLKQIIAQRGALPEAEALGIAAQIAAALGAAHARGVVHRDIKPHNVLIGPEGRAEVADFGIARATGMTQLTLPNTVYGTAHYLSPEQARGSDADVRSDLYSLGVVLYEMLTGRVPFEAETPVGLAMKHVYDQPVPPRQLNPAISPSTQAVVLKALAKDPADRYQSADEMRRAINSSLESLSHPAMAATQPIPTAQPRPAAPPPSAKQPRAEVQPSPSIPAPRARPVRESHPAASSSSRLGLLLAVLLLLAGGGYALHAVAGGMGPSSGPKRSAGSSHKTKHSASPVATVRVKATAVPTSAPALAVAAPTATPQPAADPGQTVINFYLAVAHHDFAGAVQFWTPHMQAQCDPSACIDQRFASVQWVTIRQAHATSQSSDAATVATDVLLTEGSPASIDEYTGNWYLVRGPNGWLLNGESLTPVQGAPPVGPASAPATHTPPGHDKPHPGHGKHPHGQGSGD